MRHCPARSIGHCGTPATQKCRSRCKTLQFAGTHPAAKRAALQGQIVRRRPVRPGGKRYWREYPPCCTAGRTGSWHPAARPSPSIFRSARPGLPSRSRRRSCRRAGRQKSSSWCRNLPGKGMAIASISCRRPASSRVFQPRLLIARLMERPAPMASLCISGRRSYTVTS
jgi:hypothetical protein